jgi:hypothetical protein
MMAGGWGDAQRPVLRVIYLKITHSTVEWEEKPHCLGNVDPRKTNYRIRIGKASLKDLATALYAD